MADRAPAPRQAGKLDSVFARSTEVASVLSSRGAGEPGVLVVGERGMGRTTLALVVADALRREGADVVVVRATRSAKGIRLGALAPVDPTT